jgi:sugar lactone lactonase YvrE
LFDLAGTGAAGFFGDGGPATAAQLNLPNGVAIDSDGQVAVADSVNHRIRFVSRDGFVSTGAGTGVAGLSGDGAAATAAQLNHPQGVAATPDGGLLIADTYNHRVRRVSPGGQITTVAGSGRGFGGDGGPATAAQLAFPLAVAPTPDGGFLIADFGNRRVRKVSSAGIVSTVAGSGQRAFAGDGGPAAAAGLDAGGVAANPDGGFVIADTSNARVRRVGPDGHISTIAGTGARGSGGDGGPATAAQLFFPADVEVAPDGSVLVADSGANRVRWIDPSETIRTLAGVGTAGYDGDGRDARLVQLNDPRGVAVGRSGDVVVAEGDGHRLRLILAGLVPAPTGAPQPTPPPSTGTPRSQRLVAALAQQSLRIRRRARVRLAYVLTDDARVSVELRRRGRRVAGARQAGRAGRNQITLRRPRRPGRYQLRLTATGSDGRVSVDRGRLIVVR